MAKKRKKAEKEEISITAAVDNLSGIAELGVAVEKEGETTGVKGQLYKFQDLKAEEKEEILLVVKGTFKTVHKYLQHVYTKDKKHFKDRDMQRGIKAIMVLADEAADKLNKCSALFKHTYKEGKVAEIKEYKDLKTYFKKNILKRFEEVLVSETKWQEEWAVEDETIDIGRQGLKDLEMVKRDKEYELFYIRKDDGKPFFNRNLLRHIKLVSDFDELVREFEGEDPLLRIHILLDHEAHSIAQEIRESAKIDLGNFYAAALHHKEVPFVGVMLKLTMSLMLACNPHNRLENTMGKVCTRYLKDFHHFLRDILDSPDYQKFISVSIEETDRLARAILHLIHAFCFAFFTHSGKKQEMLDYLHDLIKRAWDGEAPARVPGITTDHFMSQIFTIHDRVSEMLKKFPSGPLFKILDIFQDRNKKEGFDPINQGNPPYYLYTFSSEAFDSSCLKIPCPTFHTHINKAEVIHEFEGFLRHFEAKKELQKHLHFNLQDRTSWEEHARCEALEKLQKKAEFSNQFVLATLPKKNNFYFQTEDYLKVDRTEGFIKLLEEQVKSGEECGCFFSKQIDKKKLQTYVKKIIPIIHTNFFKKKVKLPRKERLDFIEIFYLFLELKILEMVKPATFTFSCKDGVDIGATASAAFFTLLKFLGKNEKWSLKEQDHLVWTLCGPALTIRERLVDYQRLSRMASALSILATYFARDHDKILKVLQPLFRAKFFQQIEGEF
ncbi:MAG: hypothetical protein QNJ27_03310 [Simkaniaceae bacterium]|nr:hypothetical protein [Simkaniaceae bacterium]